MQLDSLLITVLYGYTLAFRAVLCTLLVILRWPHCSVSCMYIPDPFCGYHYATMLACHVLTVALPDHQQSCGC